jgi:hypothetical protein
MVNGFKISILGSRELTRLEPNVKGLGGIKIDGYGVINSFELVSQPSSRHRNPKIEMDK